MKFQPGCNQSFHFRIIMVAKKNADPMKTLILLILQRILLVLALVNLLPGCMSVAIVDSKSLHIGSVEKISACHADDGHAYVTWQVRKHDPPRVSVVDLKTRNAHVTHSVPSRAVAVPVVVLAGEDAALPDGQARPCLGIWRCVPQPGAGPWAPRVRWFGKNSSISVNLPARVAEPGRIAALLPFAIVGDTMMLGMSAAMTVNPYGPTGEGFKKWDESGATWGNGLP